MKNHRLSELHGRLWHGADYNYEQWLHSPEILAEDFRLMKAAGCTAMSIGIFSWAMLEPEEGRYAFDWLDRLMDSLQETGVRAILATPSAAHPGWLSLEYPEVLRVNRDGSRELHRARQLFCRTSSVFREKCAAINTRLAERYRDHPALLLWHISNEYGSTPCYCESCLGDFRRWLQEKYEDLDAVNRAWWTTFWSHRYGSWEEIFPVDVSNNGLMLDWQRYNSDQVLDFYLAEIEPLRRLTPQTPITTNFMRPDVGLNYWKIARYVDVVSWDSYPEWHVRDDRRTAAETAFYHDLHRGYHNGAPFYLIESSPAQTNWQPLSRLKRPGMLQLASAQALAHGALGVNYFQWRQSRGGEEKFHGAVILHRGSESSRTFEDVQRVGQMLDAFPDLAGARTEARVALIYDLENEWALNMAFLPRKAAGEYQKVCIDYYQALWERGFAVDIVGSEGPFEKYPLLIAPMLHMLSEEKARRIAEFVSAGGAVLTTFLSGWVDETDLCHLGGYPVPLGDVLGLSMVEFDTFGSDQHVPVLPLEGNPLGLQIGGIGGQYAEILQPEKAEVIASYAGEFYAGSAAVTLNRHEKGLAVHVGAHLDHDFLGELLGRLCAHLDIQPDIPSSITGDLIGRIRKAKEAEYLFVMNFSDQPVPLLHPEGGWVQVFESVFSEENRLGAYGVRVYSRELQEGSR